MVNNVEKYLEILYPNIEDIDDEQYKKDKAFLETYLPQFEAICEEYSDMKSEMSEREFLDDALYIAKEQHDPETKIVSYAKGMLEALETNGIFGQKFDLLMGAIETDLLKNFKAENGTNNESHITLEEVFQLTEEFLRKIDPEHELFEEFEDLIYDWKIEVISPKDKEGSRYSHQEGKIYYEFDGTLNTAHTLVHEFMHHISFKEAQTNMGYDNFTMFREFLSIYYEKAFIQFMDEKGLLPNGQESLLAERLKSQFQEDTENCLPIYLELSHRYMENSNLGKEDILSVGQKYFPGKSAEELWEHVSKLLVQFSDKNHYGMEVGAGLTTYMFSTAMAYEAKSDEETLSKMFRLAKYVKDGKSDLQALEGYFEIVGETEKELIDRLHGDKSKEISVKEIGRKTAKMQGIMDELGDAEKILTKWKDIEHGKEEVIH